MLPSCNRLTFTVARIGDNSFVGPFVEIQKGVRIGRRCRIQSHAFICELVVIGDDCFVSHGAMFINDLFDTGGPAGGDRNLWKETKIGNHVSIGTNATILPVTICDRVVVGAGAVVTKDITEPGIYVGNPARLLRVIALMRPRDDRGQRPEIRGQRAEARSQRSERGGECRSSLLRILSSIKRPTCLRLRFSRLANDFPAEEKYSLTDQIRRSSRSVCANLREAWAEA